ncbi:MAG: hypothetical protein WDN06_19935 [Asticcacaulis sp.]
MCVDAAMGANMATAAMGSNMAAVDCSQKSVTRPPTAPISP